MKCSKWSSMLKAATFKTGLLLASLILFAACATTPTDADSGPNSSDSSPRTPQSIQHRL